MAERTMKTGWSALLALTLTALGCPGGFAGEAGSSTPAGRVDFANDLIPVFTKAGCNAAACHGAAIGRGGFKLSLYGGNPAADYEAIVRQVEGRRVNLARPEESLIVLKPTKQIAHRGGRRLVDGKEGAELLLRWIRQGAGLLSSRSLARVEVAPRKHVAEKPGSSIQLRATAYFSDGSSQDVTRWTVFTAEDPSAVKIDSESAAAKLLRRGRQIVIARYLDRVTPIELIVPLSGSKPDLAAEPRRGFIDREILDALSTLRLSPSPMADDATFLRRVTLDLSGRLPTTTAARAFLADPGPKKRQGVIDRLLASEEFSQYWTLQLAKLLRIHPDQGSGEVAERDQQGALKYHQWLHRQVRDNVGYDRLARSVILATGDSHEVGPANFYRTVKGPRKQAEFMSEVFMGSRLRCANCHNHPLDRWTQDDYHGLAAIFARIEGGQVVKVKASGEVIHPRTLEKALQRIPGEDFLGADIVDGRGRLASWLTDPANPYFSRAIVNRLWKAMMGRGLVEPADDFRATNPPTHPALLAGLADDFVKNGYDLRHTLRTIALSAAYSRSSKATAENKADGSFYSHAIRQGLEPEVLADAISDVLGVAGRYGEEPKGTRAVTLVDPKTRSVALDILGRCSREESCESPAGSTGGLQRKLHLFNGALLNARIGAPGGRLDKMIAAGESSLSIAEHFYLVALGRYPGNEESAFWKEQLGENVPAGRQRELLEDFVWSLLVCNEFVSNH
ncbi:MAG: DUF1549 and DUF1553 domain-containing protein [Planctomycetota bacterium]|nr:DUF1549 and DUF1553 domain-containing protein [Planctomycetota bacterium]